MSVAPELLRAFDALYERPAERVFFAPGRVNLIGEHTDYNEGFVLPCAIQFGTQIAVALRQDHRVQVASLSYQVRPVSFELSSPIPKSAESPWSDYVRAVFDVLLRRSHPIQGLDILLMGDVPQGAGLSSSASLQVAVGLCLSEVNGLGLSPAEVALLAQEAENEYVGCRCGVMDQLASSASEAGHATLIDCRDLSLSAVPVPEGAGLFIVNSNVKRGLVESAYNERRAQCEEAARLMGTRSLRDVSLEELRRAEGRLPELTFRRARHVITENQRVLEAVDALKGGDLGRLGRLMRASHDALRFDFEVTVPQVDLLAQLLNEVIGERGGARMTGGGFGGCVVAVAPLELIPALSATITTHYEAQTGLTPTMYLCHASAGAHQIRTA